MNKKLKIKEELDEESKYESEEEVENNPTLIKNEKNYEDKEKEKEKKRKNKRKK